MRPRNKAQPLRPDFPPARKTPGHRHGLISQARWGKGPSLPTRALPLCRGRDEVMKVRNSLKSLRLRHRDNQIVRRKGRVYILNKVQKRYKARQG